MTLNWNFLSGGLEKNPFRGGDMDNLRNYTFSNLISTKEKLLLLKNSLKVYYNLKSAIIHNNI